MSGFRRISIAERSDRALVLKRAFKGARIVISSQSACFGYQIRSTPKGWAWVVYDLNGQVQGQGCAPQKAIAAAMVVRALARSAAEDRSTAAA